MRFKLNLSMTDRKQNVLPVNYQYELSAWIYKIFNQSDPEFTTWLDDKGYCDSNKQFRLFTFSNFNVRHREILGDRLIIKADPIELIISTLPEEAIQPFVLRIFGDREFRLGDRISSVGFKINSIEVLPPPVFTDEMCFRSLSPIFVSQKIEGRKQAKHLSPIDEGYNRLIINNLKEKLRVFTGIEPAYNASDAGLELTSPPKQKGIAIKTNTPQATKLIGYHYNFRIKADAELLRIGYYTGFGEKGNQGFGCCEVK